jgi:hypothetical protein
MTKIEGSGSISQRHGSAEPDPDLPQNVMDPQHCFLQLNFLKMYNNFLSSRTWVWIGFIESLVTQHN